MNQYEEIFLLLFLQLNLNLYGFY